VQIDRARPRQTGADNGRDESGTEHTVGNTGFEMGFFRIALVDMGWIQITGDIRKEVDVGFRNRLGKLGTVTQIQLTDLFSHHEFSPFPYCTL
jgi:hypothetical protein